MGTGKPPGRPPKGEGRNIRWTDEEWDEIQEAAERSGLKTRSEYIRNLVKWDVKRLLKD